MSEILTLTIFWIFLFALGVLFLYKATTKEDTGILGEAMATGMFLLNAFYSLSIPFTSQATNYIMVGICIMFMIISLFAFLKAIPDIFKLSGEKH